MNTPAPRPRFGEKFCYGFGDLASVLYWQTFMAYLLIYYTDVFGITAAAAGTMFLISRIWDGVNDPMMGMFADRTKTRWGKFRPYLLWICVPFAFMGVLTFTTPHMGYTGKLVWAYFTYNGLMMLYTAINIPYTAMLGVVSPDSDDRTTLSSIKFLFAFAAGSIVSFTLLPMVKRLSPGNPQHGWQLAFMIYGVAAVIFFLIVFFNTKERVTPPSTQKTSIANDLKQLFTNGPWLVLLATTVTFILFVATRLTVTAHYFKYYVGPRTLTIPFAGGPKTYSFDTLVSWFNGVGQVASFVGVLLVIPTARWLGRKKAFISIFLVAVASNAAFYVLKPDQVIAMFVLQVIGSLTGGPLSVLIWVMYADTADYGEWKNSCRSTGLVFSASTMSQKGGWAIGGAAAGWTLSATGFVANVGQTEAVKHGLVLMMSIVPAIVGLISVAIVAFYPLNEEKMRRIGEELAARRAAAGAQTAT